MIDIHRIMAAKILKVGYNQVTDSQRRAAKSCLYLAMYSEPRDNPHLPSNEELHQIFNPDEIKALMGKLGIDQPEKLADALKIHFGYKQ